MSLQMWRADAVVLHHWLTTVDLETVPFEHPAQKQAFLDLLTELDQTDAAVVSDEEIVQAHEVVERPAPQPATQDAEADEDIDDFAYDLEPF